MSNQQPQKGVTIEIPQQLKGGVYSNNMIVSHTREEFVMDFLMTSPSGTVVTSRVIMSPGHIKRVVAALQDNIKKYENNIGQITQAPAPTKRKLGFQTT